jgi:hypothetical protein
MMSRSKTAAYLDTMLYRIIRLPAAWFSLKIIY